MQACRDSGGEDSPFFEELQESCTVDDKSGLKGVILESLYVVGSILAAFIAAAIIGTYVHGTW